MKSIGLVLTWSSVGALALAAIACGGSSKSFEASPADGGAGPDATAGTAGSNAAGKAGAGSGSGGKAAGGTGGTSSAEGGGSFNPGAIGGLVGGSAAGGAGSGGTNGISPAVVDGCNALCAKEAAQKCPNSGTLSECVVGCRLMLNNPKCAEQSSALFTCEKDSPVACDAQGEATLTACSAEQLGAAACFLQNAADPSLSVPCKAYCANVAAAQCPGEDNAGCQTGCPIVGNFIPSCNQYWKEYVACASTAKISCDADGKATPAGCDQQGLAYVLCTAGGLGSAGAP